MLIQTSLWEKKAAQALINSEIHSVQSLRVLIVDDEPICRKMTTLLLEDLGFKVDAAESGKQALSMLDNKYDAVFLDIDMPDLSGIEVCKIMRSKMGFKDIPIFVLSSRASEMKEECLCAGMNEVIDKPAHEGDFVRVLGDNNILDKKLAAFSYENRFSL